MTSEIHNETLAFAKDSAINFFIKVLIFVLTAFTSVITARALGPHGKGILTLALLIPTLAAAIGSMGIAVSNVYFIGQRKYAVRLIVGNSLLVTLCQAIITALILLFVGSLFSKQIMAGNSGLWYLGIFVLFFSLFNENATSILLGLRKIKELCFVRLLTELFFLGFVVCLLSLWHLSATGAILAKIVSLIGAFTIAVHYIIKNGYRFQPVFDSKLMRNMVTFGLKGHAGTIFQFFNYRLDMFLVAYFLTPSDVGQYAVAVSMAELIWFIPNSISEILLSKTSSSSIKTANDFTPKVCRVTVLLTMITSFWLLMLSSLVIELLFGSQFVAAILPLRILLPGVVALSLWKIIANDLAGRGLPQYKTYTSIISLLMTISLDLLFIPRLGIAGAALATSISYIGTAVVLIYWFVRITRLEVSALLLPKKEDFETYLRTQKFLSFAHK